MIELLPSKLSSQEESSKHTKSPLPNKINFTISGIYSRGRKAKKENRTKDENSQLKQTQKRENAAIVRKDIKIAV